MTPENSREKKLLQTTQLLQLKAAAYFASQAPRPQLARPVKNLPFIVLKSPSALEREVGLGGGRGGEKGRLCLLESCLNTDQ